jgi:hypothetical protein
MKSMIQDSAWLTLVEQAPIIGACDLCATDPASLESLVIVRHGHGGEARFGACTQCTRAMRRVLAAIGSDSRILGRIAIEATSPASARITNTRIRPRPRPRVFSAEVLAELSEHFIDEDGTRYVIRVCGGQRHDGRWSGWLEFAAIGARRIRRTGQETTQQDRESLMYWATGLGTAYYEGAFARAA